MSVAEADPHALVAAPSPGGWTSLRAWWRSRPAALALVPVAVLTLIWVAVPSVLQAVDAARHHGVFIGVTAIWPMDQLQYLAWARDAGSEGLIRNLYGLGGAAVFVHPLWSPLGWLQAAARLPTWMTMALAQLLACMMLLAGSARLVWRRLGTRDPGRRSAALLLCVFGGLTPLALMLARMAPGIGSFELRDAANALLGGSALWAYAPAAIAVGLMPFALDAIETLLSGAAAAPAWRRAALLGLLISWLHPWQGEELLLIALGLTWWSRPQVRRALPRVLVVTAATAAPLGYYLALSHLDVGWQTSSQQSVAAAAIPWPVVATCLLPLLVLTLAAGRRVGLGPQTRVLVLWPLAVGLTTLLTANGQYRTLAGLPLPLAVLAVRAWPDSLPHRRLLAGLALLAAVAPAAVFARIELADLGNGQNVAYAEPTPDDLSAMRVAAQAARGTPILTTAETGTEIPALVDARVWLGHPVWTPQATARTQAADELFSGQLTPRFARRFVRSVGASALLQPCGYDARLGPVLAPLGFRQLSVGCARVLVRR